MRMITTRERDEHGAVAILVAIFSVALFVLAALVVDLGQARDTRRNSQNAADAAALAGANVLYPKSNTCTSGTTPCVQDAVDAAKLYAEQNNKELTSADWSAAGNGCTVPAGFSAKAGQTSCVTFDSLSTPTKVRVFIPLQRVKTNLGVAAGVSSVDVGAAARATLSTTQQGKCALCFLGGVTVGNGDFDISGGSVHVNGDLNIGAGSYWTANHIYVAGNWNSSDESRITPDPEKAQTITDPFATDSRFPPSVTGLSSKSGSPCSGGPGIYGSYTWGANEDCTIAPGLYVVDGTWELKNNSGITGNGVTLYVRNGSLDFKNSGKVALVAPTAAQAASTGGVAGFVVVYDRTNAQELSLQGNGTTTNDGSGCTNSGTPSLDGGIYAPSASLSVNGVSCLAVNHGPIVVLSVDSNQNFNGTKSGLKLFAANEISIDNLPKSIYLDQ